MAPLGHVELTKMQKLLKSKNKNEKQNENKNENLFLFSFSFLFTFCFSFSFLFLFLFYFLVFCFEFYYGTSRPSYSSFEKVNLSDKEMKTAFFFLKVGKRPDSDEAKVACRVKVNTT